MQKPTIHSYNFPKGAHLQNAMTKCVFSVCLNNNLTVTIKIRVVWGRGLGERVTHIGHLHILTIDIVAADLKHQRTLIGFNASL